MTVSTCVAAAVSWAAALPLCLKAVAQPGQVEKTFNHFSTALDQTLDSVFIFRPDTLRYFYVNQGAAELVGYSREELRRMTPLEIQPDIDKATLRRIMAPLVNGSVRSQHFETVHRRKDGGLVPVEVTLQYVALRGRKPWFVAIVRDITRRRKAEQELQRSEALFRAVVNNSPAKIHIKDAEGRYILVNPVAESLYGVTDAEARGKTTAEIFGPERASIFTAHDFAVMESRRPVEQEEEWPGEDGVHTYLTVKFPIVDRDGLVTGVGAIGTDITERKRIEARLVQTQKMDSLGNLAGGLAHEINNTLVPVMGLTELVFEELPDGSQARSNLEEVLQGCERAKRLVSQILAFSRPGGDGRELVQFDRIVRETLSLVRATLPATIRIRETIEDCAGPILADPAQLQKVLLNLASNAGHAMGSRPGVLEINLKRVKIGNNEATSQVDLAPGEYAVLSVTDSGPGMSKETLQRIFEPYFTTKPVGEGAGLGLSVVHGIVKSHKGSVSASSEPGRGSTFVIHLPIEHVQQIRAESSGAAE